MKNFIITTLSIITLSQCIFSQNSISGVLKEVERNNTRLQAFQKKGIADKLENKTGIFLENPEIEYNYLWGNPEQIGNRTDFGIYQSFEFPLAYRYKKSISSLKNKQIDIEYEKQWKEIRLHTKVLCLELIYTNAIATELNKRKADAEKIAMMYKTKFELGESNLLDYNKARLNLLNINKKAESHIIQRQALLAELARQNGGIFILFNDSVYSGPSIPNNFETWYVQSLQDNPDLELIKQESEIGSVQVKLNRTLSLPKFKAGYMSEKVENEEFRGISVGMSIPLWENRNTVKQARAHSLALQSAENDTRIQIYNYLSMLYQKALRMKLSVETYRKDLETFNNSVLLDKALEKGEIGLIDYLLELSLYYDNIEQLLEMEKDMHIILAELHQFE
ncbi:MAG: TolC family protein [Bacteroidales bacterium]|nr:TolC family protein [Bacteroidales bacterium]